MEALRTRPRTAGTRGRRNPGRKHRRDAAGHRMPPATHPVEDCSAKLVEMPLTASSRHSWAAVADWQPMSYEIMLAVPIRRKCFAIRLFTGLTNWSSFQMHRAQAEKGDGASADKMSDPFA